MAHGMPPMPPLRFMLSLAMYRNRVPRRLRFWLIIFIAVLFQLSGAVYASSITQITGELAYINEDVTMASYCSLIGLNMIFPMMFRWKFGLFTRQLWFIAAAMVGVTAVIACYATSPWLLSGACLVGGYFKMMGMFQCMSSVQLNITPTRNFAAFFPVVYIIVFGSVQLSNILATQLAWWGNWRLMYCVVVAMMCAVIAIVYFLMKPDHRSGPPIPIKGIDWWGQLLWTGVLVGVTYICNYGRHYDWWESPQIWNATWVTIVLAAVATGRMLRLGDKAYITAAAWRQPVTWWLWALMLGIAIVSATAHELVPLYTGSVLGADSLKSISLNVPMFWGIAVGAILAYWILVRLRWGLKSYFGVVFVMAGMYAVTMYMLMTAHTQLEMLCPPSSC